jgi:hypothetical protein
MSNLPSRRQREQRAYGLVLATGALSVVSVVAIVLAVVGVISWGPGILAAVLAALCAYGFRRMVKQ